MKGVRAADAGAFPNTKGTGEQGMKSIGKSASWLALLAALVAMPALAQDAIVFHGVRVFDGVGPSLSEPTNVRISGNRIEAIGPTVSTEGARVSSRSRPPSMPARRKDRASGPRART